jgi:acyl-CoA synthetase (AMP-forming)/AMP-acid ligase II
METPLSPLDFARRTRRLHADREAVVDGDLRLTYRQFFDRCDRWSSALQELGVAQHPAVQEVAIVGLPHEKWGETPHAFVVLRDGGSATEEEIIAFARERLAHFKAPRGVTFSGELPKSATGKIQKYVLRKGAPNLSRQ